MILTPWSKLSFVIDGDDLHVALVSGAPWGARARRGPTLHRFLATPVEEARAALAPFSSARRVVLTCPAAWCALRPVQVTTAQWPGAREEFVRSIDRLLPLSPDDVLVGLIDEGDGASPAERGCLVAVRRSQAQPWIDAIARALGRPVNEVISAHMAMPGLGLQREPIADVVERSGGVALRHRLAFGRPVSFAEPLRDSDDESGARVAFPAGAEAPADASELTPQEIAIGSALSPAVAPGVYSPLIGRAARRRPAWIAPAGAVAVAALLLVSARPVYESRLERGAESLRAEQEAMVETVARVNEMRRQTERYARLVGEGVAKPTESWGSVLPMVVEAQTAVGERGYFYRVEVGREHFSFTGEVGGATATLERLEASPLLELPRFRSPVRPSAVAGLDVVDIRADRRGRRAK